MSKKVFLPIAFFLITMVVFSSFQTQQDHKVLFEKAKYTMETKADLKVAIDLFERLIIQYPNEKEYVAKSLLYQGMCYEKLGNQEAVKKYQKLVSNYPGQKNEVAFAKERLSKLVIAEKDLEIPAEPKFTKINIPNRLGESGALSPDGKNLALVSDKKLWKIPLSGKLGSDFPGIPEQLKTDGAEVPDWSPLSWSQNGKWIAFNNGQSIYVVSSDGGKPKKVIEINRDSEALNYRISLSPNGNILAFSSVEENKQHIFSTPVDKVIPRQLVEMESREPVFSPDGKHIAFVEDKNKGVGWDNLGLWVIEANGGKPYKLADASKANSPKWSHDGKLIAFLDGADQICIVPFSKTTNTIGKVIRIDAPEGASAFISLAGWTPDNKIGAFTRNNVKYGLYTLPVEGGQAAIILHDAIATQPRWSKNGEQIYYVTTPEKWQGRGYNLASVSASGGKGKPLKTNYKGKYINQLTFQSGNRVSPDGKWIVTSTWTQADTNTINVTWPASKIWKVSVDGEDAIQVTNTPGNFFDSSPCWSADGKKIAFVHTELIKNDIFGDSRIYLIDSNGGEPELLDPNAGSFATNSNINLIWSPDGKMIAYPVEKKSTETNVLKIIDIESRDIRVIEEFPEINGNTELVWSPDSKRIAFGDENGKVIKIMNIDDGSIEDIETGLPDVRIIGLDWSPDGKRFVFGGRTNRRNEFWLMEDFLPLEEIAEQHLKKGNELFGLWEYEKAIEEYKKAMEPDPKSLIALNAQYCIGQTWFRLGKYDLAMETFKKLVEKNPQSNIAPVTELMISQVKHAMKEQIPTTNTSVSEDKNTITDKETGITYRKIKSFMGKNDLIKWTTGGFNLSPDARFLVSDNIVVPINGEDSFTLADMDASRTIYSPDMKKAAFYADSAIWTVSVVPETGRSAATPEKLISGNYKWQHNVSWSPDGKKLAFIRSDEITVSDIWTISVKDGKLTPVTESESYKRSPAWSPDGSTIAYNDDGVWLASVSTNEKKQIIKNTMNARPRWLSNGNWLFYAATGKSFLYSSTAQKNYQFSFPEKKVGDFIGTSPNGDKMLFYRPSYEDKWNLKVVSISGGPSFNPVPGHNIYDARWSGDSKLFLTLSEKNQGEYIFESVPLSGDNSLQVLIDVKSEEEPFPIQGSPDLSKLAFWLPGKENTKDLYVAPFSAPKARTTGPARLVFEGWSGGPYNVSFSWSPDGTQIALVHNGDIWIVPVGEGTPLQITNTPEKELYVNWSPDGEKVGYLIINGDNRSMYLLSKTGGVPKLIAENITTGRWFPDNKRACILRNGNINIISLEDGKVLEHIFNIKDLGLDDCSSPDFSPNGKKMVFSGQSGTKSGIYIYSFENKEFAKIAEEIPGNQIYLEGWSPDGKWYAYTTEEEEKVRPEGVLWEADFEEVKAKLFPQENN